MTDNRKRTLLRCSLEYQFVAKILAQHFFAENIYLTLKFLMQNIQSKICFTQFHNGSLFYQDYFAKIFTKKKNIASCHLVFTIFRKFLFLAKIDDISTFRPHFDSQHRGFGPSCSGMSGNKFQYIPKRITIFSKLYQNQNII